MASEERTQEILKELRSAVVNYDEDKVVEWANVAVNEGVDPFVATIDGLADGMIQVGDLYNRKEYFVPELLMCSDALYAGLGVLKPAIEASGRKALRWPGGPFMTSERMCRLRNLLKSN
jgi:methanogenic corrinoid protein MtbC1